MQEYSAYCENGRIIPIGNPVIPEGKRIIITVLDESVDMSSSQKQLDALKRFWEETKDCNEPLDSGIKERLSALERFREGIRSSDELLDEEFDEIISQRVNIAREIDL